MAQTMSTPDLKSRKRELKLKALATLNALREEAQRQNPGITAEEAYRLAGFSEEIIQETLKADQELASSKP